MQGAGKLEAKDASQASNLGCSQLSNIKEKDMMVWRKAHTYTH